jgi:hypothetical protein
MCVERHEKDGKKNERAYLCFLLRATCLVTLSAVINFKKFLNGMD